MTTNFVLELKAAHTGCLIIHTQGISFFRDEAYYVELTEYHFTSTGCKWWSPERSSCHSSVLLW